MSNINNNMLSRQLSSLAENLSQLQGEDLVMTLLDTCTMLVDMATEQSTQLITLDSSAKDRVLPVYVDLSTVFAGSVDSVSSQGEQSVSMEDNENLLSAKLRVLKEEKEKQVELMAQIEDTNRKLQIVRKQNEALKANCDTLQSQYDDLLTVASAIENQLKELTPELIKEHEKTNEELLKEFLTRQQEVTQLKIEKDDLVKKIDEYNKDIDRIKADIGALPEEDKQLHKEYSELSAQLEAIQQAQINCSEEEQLKLKDKISELTPIVNELKTDFDELSATYEKLKEHKVEYDEQKCQVYGFIYSELNEIIKVTASILKDYRDELDVVKGQADTLNNSLDECNKLRNQYANWFDGIRPPLEEMLAAFKLDEHAKLRETLDINQSNRIQTLFSEVKERLFELDNILSICNKAATADQKILEGRVLG